MSSTSTTGLRLQHRLKAWKIGNWTFFAIVLAYIVVAFLINIFQCVPAIMSFDYIAIGRSGLPPNCVGVAEMNTILRVINITRDFCFLRVPIIVVWSLQMSLRKKLRIAGVFAFGALACVGSVLALIAKYHLKTDALCTFEARSACMYFMIDIRRKLYLPPGLVARRARLWCHCRVPTYFGVFAPCGIYPTANYAKTANSRANGTFDSQRQITDHSR